MMSYVILGIVLLVLFVGIVVYLITHKNQRTRVKILQFVQKELYPNKRLTVYELNRKRRKESFLPKVGLTSFSIFLSELVSSGELVRDIDAYVLPVPSSRKVR